MHTEHVRNASYHQRRQLRGQSHAFATRDPGLLSKLSRMTDPPIPWIPSAVARWLLELPDLVTGLGRLESLALQAIRGGCDTPET